MGRLGAARAICGPDAVFVIVAHSALVRAARESMVLLKNDANFLPLKKDGEQTIAVIGPLAASLIGLEGNYNAIPLKPILPIDGIASEFGNKHVLYSEGSPYIMGGSVPVPRTLLRTAADPNIEGLTAEYFPAPSFEGKPEVTRVDKQIDFDWSAANPVQQAFLPIQLPKALQFAGPVPLPHLKQIKITSPSGSPSAIPAQGMYTSRCS